MDLLYMQRMKFYLKVMGGWPAEELQAVGEKPRKYPLRNFSILFILWVGFLTVGAYNLVRYTGKYSFFQLDHSYVTVFMNFIAVQRLTMPLIKAYRSTVTEFVLKLHLFHHRHRSSYALQVNNQVEKICSIYTTCLLIQMLLCGVLFNFTPLYSNIQSGAFEMGRYNKTKYEYAIYHYLPQELKVTYAGYAMIFLLNIFATFICSILFCIYDLITSLVVFHLWGHLKILKYHLENFPLPARMKAIDPTTHNSIMYTEEESRNVLKMMIQNVEHHRMIKRVMAQASQGFGMMIGFYYTFHQVTGCILLLKALNLTDTSSLSRYGVLTLLIFEQMIQISIVFELISSKSETLKDAVYSLPWECMDIKNRKIVLFFLYNVQSPLSLKAMGLIPVGVRTMAAILKTSFSYFIMLRTFAEN